MCVCVCERERERESGAPRKCVAALRCLFIQTLLCSARRKPAASSSASASIDGLISLIAPVLWRLSPSLPPARPSLDPRLPPRCQSFLQWNCDLRFLEKCHAPARLDENSLKWRGGGPPPSLPPSLPPSTGPNLHEPISVHKKGSHRNMGMARPPASFVRRGRPRPWPGRMGSFHSAARSSSLVSSAACFAQSVNRCRLSR